MSHAVASLQGSSKQSTPASSNDDGVSDRLKHVIHEASHVLPAQGPITVFIHHNTLHAFEDLPFAEAVQRGARVFGCEPFLPLDRYREYLRKGRIRFADLHEVLVKDLSDHANAPVLRLGARAELRLAMLEHPHYLGTADELDFFMAENESLLHVREGVSASVKDRLISETRRWTLRDLMGGRSQHTPRWANQLLKKFGQRRIEEWKEKTWEAFSLECLWRLCLDGVAVVPRPDVVSPSSLRHRDLFVEQFSVDPDLWVNEHLTRFVAAFLDQGVSQWPLPGRELGFLRCYMTLQAHAGNATEPWLSGLHSIARDLLTKNVDALAFIIESLADLGVPESEWQEYLKTTLLSLRGWAGMVLQVEDRGDRVAHPIPAGSLFEFLAVRLLLDRLALAYAAKTEMGYNGPLRDLRQRLAETADAEHRPTIAERAFQLFQLAQVRGWSPEDLHRLTPDEWGVLIREVEGFDEIERRRIFHLAYERTFRKQVLDLVALHAPSVKPNGHRPQFQAIACLDEREESFRRHLEEVAPNCETFGAAGFFGVAMYYRGAADAYFVPLCPIVLTPGHWVAELPCDGEEHVHQSQTQTRKTIGKLSWLFSSGSRSAALGALLTAGLGALAAVPLVARILLPRLTAWWRKRLGQTLITKPNTRLKLERQADPPGTEQEHIGYSVSEMAALGERFLRDIGLTKTFSRLIFILGHGSNSLNNPHKSAYDCGACGGSPGAPNGRALAQILNDRRVREKIGTAGIQVPEETIFVGGYHNTCDDSVELFDTESLPASHRAEFDSAIAAFQETSKRNAHERCRRFETAPLGQSFDDALLHVQSRSEDLAQVRPELGHATNAMCFVGRRSQTRGLFLDRRAFLASYDPDQDDANGSTLARLLGAAVPVCGGINLEYYFSRVDNAGYGCGTKLPHNVTALLGVMDGAASDLRTGLPWQMVEIHEPVRLLFVVETTPQVLLGIMDRMPLIGTMIRNGWVQVALQNPKTGEISVYEEGDFRKHETKSKATPRANSSWEWYRGWREHLDFAEITPT